MQGDRQTDRHADHYTSHLSRGAKVKQFKYRNIFSIKYLQNTATVHCRVGTRVCRSNKAVTDRRLRPRCCHLGSYFKRAKSSPVRPLAYNCHYCAQFIAKPKAACALRFSWAATSSNLGL